MKNDCNYFYPPLPPKLKNQWNIIKSLTISEHAQVYVIKNTTNSIYPENTRILKVVHKAFFSKNIYKKIMSIESEYILKPLEIIPFKQNYYIIMPYYNNLGKIICKDGISGNDILHIAHDICISLKQLNTKKVLHLDCTPANIYLNADDSYCLGDFSSAVMYNTHNKSTSTTSTTPEYMPPEISEGLEPTPASDIYIFSCMLYALFNNGHTINNSDSDNSIKDNIPPELYSVIVKGCAKNPSDRYSSIEELEDKLNSNEISEKIFSCNYHLNITDTSHPLYYLKTPLINNNSHTKNNKHFRTNIICITLILITGTIFLFSLYNYYKQNNNNPQKEKKFNAEITEITSNNITDAPTNTPMPTKTPIFTSTPTPTTTSAPITNTPVATPYIDITDFDISNKNLVSLPNSQNTDFSCDKLTCLYADNNKIVNLDNIKYYTSLNELYLSDNLITDLSPLEETDSLQILVLSYNNITDLLPVCSLTSLTNLDISGNNNMYNFSELISLYNLKTLNLTNTNVTKEEIDFLISYLPECQILY